MRNAGIRDRGEAVERRCPRKATKRGTLNTSRSVRLKDDSYVYQRKIFPAANSITLRRKNFTNVLADEILWGMTCEFARVR